MGRTADDTRHERGRLTRERVVEAALALVERDGGGALSMRRVAREAGFEPMSLYNHVAGREELLDLLVDRVFGEAPALPPGLGWRDGVGAWMRGARAAARAYPETFRLVGGRPVQTPVALARVDELAGALAAAGLAGEDQAACLRLVGSLTTGFLITELGLPRGGRAAVPTHVPSLAGLPHLAALAPTLARTDLDAAFERVIALACAAIAEAAGDARG